MLSVIGLKAAFVDELAPLRRDIAVIGLYSFLFEPVVADKVGGRRTSGHLFVELLKVSPRSMSAGSILA